MFLLQFPSQLHPSHCSAKRLGVTLPGLSFSLTFPCGSAGKESACNLGDLGLIPGLERSPGKGNSYPLQYSGLENSMDCIVHGVANSQTQLSDFRFYIQLTTFSNYIQRSPTTSYHSCCYHSYLGHDHLFPRLLIFCWFFCPFLLLLSQLSVHQSEWSFKKKSQSDHISLAQNTPVTHLPVHCKPKVQTRPGRFHRVWSRPSQLSFWTYLPLSYLFFFT